MDGEATAVVIASADDTLASELSEILSSGEFRCHTSRDVKVSFTTYNICSIIFMTNFCAEYCPRAGCRTWRRH